MNLGAPSPCREFHLLSAPFSCGVSWLVSVLTELRVRTTHVSPQRYPNGFWQPVAARPGFEQISPEGVSHMRYYLPALHERNEFCLQPGVEVFWEHYLNFARRADRPALLFVRDPRDAIHSLYQRNYRAISFLEYLDRAEDWPDHFPGMFRLPPAETWAAWHAMWIGLEGMMPLRVLRFEDSRAEPAAVVRAALSFLGVERSEADIARAIERSSFANTRVAMERAEAESGQVFRIARRGQIGEWKECFSTEQLRRFGGPAAEWMRRLGYAPAPESESLDPLGYALAPGTLAAEASRRSQQATRSFLGGDPAQAKWDLRQGIQSGVGGDRGRLLLSCDWVALDWTEKVLGDLATRQPLAEKIFTAFRKFNSRFALWPSIRSMLERSAGEVSPPGSDVFARLDAPSPRSSGTKPPVDKPSPQGEPLLVESDFQGFDLFGWGGRFYARARTASDLDLRSLTPAELASHRKQGRLFVADLSFEVREAVQEHLARRGK